MYVQMINTNSDDRQLKAEVAIFLDWPMTSDSYNCPSSSAREKTTERERKTNQSNFHSRVKNRQ